jgi:energy-converting hydrogenase A subunit M
MKCREARAALARSAYRVLFAHYAEIAIDTDEQGCVRSADDKAIMLQVFSDFMEKLRIRGEDQ